MAGDRIDIEELRSLLNDPEDKAKAKKEVMAPEFELDDDGEEYMPVGTKGLLAASEKLLAINRGLTDADERDSFKFQKVYRLNSMLREGIKMDAGKTARTVMYRAAKRKNLQGLDPGVFNTYVDRVITGNPLTSPLEEINPMHLVENARRISRMGPGGLKSSESITEEAQSVHPSQFGFISSIEGPECHCTLPDGKLFTKTGWVPIEEITMETELACRVDGKIEFHKPSKVIHEHYKGIVYGIRTEDVSFLVTPTHRLYLLPQGEFAYAANLYKLPCTFDCSYESLNDKGTVSITSDDWYMEHYDGMVHCATVPGGLLYYSAEGRPGVWIGNSERAGIDVRAAYGTKLGSDGKIYQKFYDRRRKQHRWLSAADLDGLTVKIPD